VTTEELLAGFSQTLAHRSRLAHMLPEEINEGRVWFETVEGVWRLREELSARH
jgi:hypothetical protein